MGRSCDLLAGSDPAPWPMNREMDPLADLPGPEDFDALLAREELRRGRTGELLAVAMIDVDGLRRVNREHSAGTGTDVLRMCAVDLRSDAPGDGRDRPRGT